MTWTTEPPTAPGWYWVRHRKGYRIISELVCLTTSGRVMGIAINCSLRHLKKHYDHFAGPIAEPKENEDA